MQPSLFNPPVEADLFTPARGFTAATFDAPPADPAALPDDYPPESDDPELSDLAAAVLSAAPFDRPPAPSQSAKGKPDAAPRRSIRADIESALKSLRIPYVNVDEVKKALFANVALKSFHFVAYPQGDMPKWLIYCGKITPASRADMEQWEQIFNENGAGGIAGGFKRVYAARTPSGIRFHDGAGEELQLESLAGVKPEDESEAE